jgi:copper homeostasis protein CutC
MLAQHGASGKGNLNNTSQFHVLTSSASLNFSQLLSTSLNFPGVVIGALTREGDVDVGQTTRLVKCARRCGLSVTYHRAFDVSRDVLASLDVLCGMGGIDRILTSGGKVFKCICMQHVHNLQQSNNLTTYQLNNLTS